MLNSRVKKDLAMVESRFYGRTYDQLHHWCPDWDKKDCLGEQIMNRASRAPGVEQMSLLLENQHE